MMLFSRRTSSGKRKSGLDLREFEYRELFRITENVYRKNVKSYKASLKQKRIELADAAAAVFAALYRSGAINVNSVWALIGFCRKTIIQQGFQETSNEEMHRFLHKTPRREIVVLVPGCQNERMLTRRIEKAIDFVSSAQRPLQIIFSGRNPGYGPIEITNEARRMSILFDELAKKRRVDLTDVTQYIPDLEDNSRNTITNINNTLRSDKFINKRKKYLFVIISSTFHLIRISQRMNEIINNNEYNIKDFVERVCLVGAENTADELPLDRHDWWYLKLMMFDLYHVHMT